MKTREIIKMARNDYDALKRMAELAQNFDEAAHWKRKRDECVEWIQNDNQGVDNERTGCNCDNGRNEVRDTENTGESEK